MSAKLLERKQTAFVLWRVGNTNAPPALIIGQLQGGAPISFAGEQRFPLQRVPGFTDLWEIPAANCNLADGQVYHYWFEVSVSHPERSANARLRITAPAGFMVDWRLRGPRVAAPFGDDDRYPASVVKFSGGRLAPADLGGDIGTFNGEPSLNQLPANNRLVLYELPTTWTRSAEVGGRDMGVGSFRDITALIDANAEGENFDDLDVTRLGRSYLTELGVNALELLPPADSTYNRDLTELVRTCHVHGLRFFVDVVMAFSKNNPYLAAACDDFFILHPKDTLTDPDAHNSRGRDDKNFRDGFGASLFRYARAVQGYDPISGQAQSI